MVCRWSVGTVLVLARVGPYGAAMAAPDPYRLDHEYPMAAELHVVVRIQRDIPGRQQRNLLAELKRSLEAWASAQPEPMRCEPAPDG